MTAPMRRLLACVREWPECETFGYDPRCCRFPKSCSCQGYDPETVNPTDLEPLSGSLTLNSGAGPTDHPEPAERLSAAEREGTTADASATGWESGDSSATDRHVGATEPGVLWMAMRYALGRATYAVAEVVEAIEKHADELPTNSRMRMSVEIIAAGADLAQTDGPYWRRAIAALAGSADDTTREATS